MKLVRPVLLVFLFFFVMVAAGSLPPDHAEAANRKKQKHAAVDDTLLIKFAPGIDIVSAKRLLKKQGLKVKKVHRNLSAAKGQVYLSVHTESNKHKEKLSIEAKVRDLAEIPEVESVDQNYEIRIIDPPDKKQGNRDKSRKKSSEIVPNFVPDDPLYSQLWGLQNMDIETAWDIETGSGDVVVFVIDTGIDTDHPDLVANLWSNPVEIPGNGIDDDGNGYIDDVHGIDTYNNDSDPEDDHSHGTHVSGTIGAQGNNATGVAGVNWHGFLIKNLRSSA